LSPHRITFVITDLDPGGAERQMVELVTRLPRKEFEPAVLVLFPPPQSPELPRRLEQAGVSIEYFHTSSRWAGLAVLRSLLRRFQELCPDIVQCFLHHANLAGALAAERIKLKRVVTGIRVAERRWNLHRWTARLMDRHVARHVCVSEAVADFARRSMGLTASKTVVIPNGVEVDRPLGVEPTSLFELGVPPGSRLLVYIGRLDRQKRVDWLLLRLPDLVGRLPNHHLVLVGQGPQEHRLRRIVQRLGMAAHVHFAGWRSDVPSVLAAADVLVLTSAWEGMPNVVLEAMAAQRPIVATKAEGVAEILGPLAATPARQLVDSGDAAAFVDAVVRLASDAALAQQIGSANRERVRQEFTMQRMVQRYCDLYRELL
jgi:glycosyltransferase involved in cell wall biosynthesis